MEMTRWKNFLFAVITAHIVRDIMQNLTKNLERLQSFGIKSVGVTELLLMKKSLVTAVLHIRYAHIN